MHARLSSRMAAAAVVLVALLCAAVSAGWLYGWLYRRPVTVTSPCPEAQEDYQVLVMLDSGFDFGKPRGDAGDMRFTASDGESMLPYWIEDWDVVGGSGALWVNVPVLGAADTLLFVYYGNAAAVTAADPAATFEVYDGFEDYALGAAPSGGGLNPGEWSRYPGNPLLEPGPAGTWDDHGATFASVIYDSLAGEFRMYYHGFSSGGIHQIGLATSPDGLAWTKYPGNPVMTPGPADWDGGSVRVPMVWKEGLADFRMIYTGNGSGGMRIGYATSADGISWTKHPSNPVFNDPTWASGQTENWGVMKVGSEYLMWYSNFGMRQSGIAVSTDLVNWAPHTPGPIFASSGVASDDRYSQFCPFSFRYGEYYYVLVPSYSSVANYSSFYLYRSTSPYFPEADRHLVRIAHTVGGAGEWDNHDNDTPCLFTLDIERTQFYNDELWCYYAAEGGSDMWKEGLLIETDIAGALADAPLPGGEISWAVSGDAQVVDSPVRHGVRSVRMRDTSTSAAVSAAVSFPSRQSGRLGAWMRRTTTSNGDLDIYLYGGSTLSCVAGLGRNGDFHYWNGAFQATGVAWSVDTWYLVTLAFDVAVDRYDFVVYDLHMNEIVHVGDVAFGGAGSFIDRAMFYTSSGFTGDGFIDDMRLMKWCGEPEVVVGAEENPVVSTYLLSSSAEFRGAFIELSWLLEPSDSQMRFAVLRAQMPGGEFEELTGAAIEREDFRFTVRDESFEPDCVYRYRVDIDTGDRQWTLFETDPVRATPRALSLGQNHPNPFNPSTSIGYYLPQRAPVSLDVFDAAGHRIVRLVDGMQERGEHRAEWDGRDARGATVSSGVYFYRLTAGKTAVSRKMVLLR
ncbi:MAG: DUF2341 domain-containing protein [Candidatus Krumholzibacteria bacterium]|nr:DUF2341 domain-containing protein [Candidatus Krumholzibacteria bacterium]